jgi:hypothetical protein
VRTQYTAPAHGASSRPYEVLAAIYDPLRGESRFQALLRKMNLPQ